MRCGKESAYSVYCEKSKVATRANALWQSTAPCVTVSLRKVATRANALWQSTWLVVFAREPMVATRANALWQRSCLTVVIIARSVATRANALWQRSIDTDKTCPPFRRNPRECAVAKCGLVIVKSTTLESQPARMRCGKVWSHNYQTCNA